MISKLILTVCAILFATEYLLGHHEIIYFLYNKPYVFLLILILDGQLGKKMKLLIY